MWISRKENERREEAMKSMRKDIDELLLLFNCGKEAAIERQNMKYTRGGGLEWDEVAVIKKTYTLKPECMPVKPIKATPKKVDVSADEKLQELIKELEPQVEAHLAAKKKATKKAKKTKK